jgi:hypothetical protein
VSFLSRKHAVAMLGLAMFGGSLAGCGGSTTQTLPDVPDVTVQAQYGPASGTGFMPALPASALVVDIHSVMRPPPSPCSAPNLGHILTMAALNILVPGVCLTAVAHGAGR